MSPPPSPWSFLIMYRTWGGWGRCSKAKNGKKMQKRDPMPMCPNSVPTGRRRAVWTGSLRGTSGALPGWGYHRFHVDHRPSGLPRTVEALISIKAHQGENLWSLTNGLAQLLLECSMRSRWKLMARQRDVKELVWMRRWSVRLFRLHVSPWIHKLIRDKYDH